MQEAVKWFRKAAGQGLPEAAESLENAYATGAGVKASASEAAKWHDIAAREYANQQNILAANNYHEAQTAPLSYSSQPSCPSIQQITASVRQQAPDANGAVVMAAVQRVQELCLRQAQAENIQLQNQALYQQLSMPQ